ncbi:MAG: ATP-binding protein, partial [Salinivirgaceae bacterium]|nr:ATP-binding protein [Salinivirgaceae bacterium]
IDYLFFSEISPLRDEFRNLYASLFKHHEKYVQIVELLASKASGLLRSEIVEQLGDNSGGGLTRILDDLETCGFIRKVYRLGNKVQNAVYQLADFYTLYYFHFLKTPVIKTANWWSTMQNTPAFSAWNGYAFEQVCIAHTHSILQSLSIGGVQSNIFPWRSKQKKGGAQIDLIIDRNDNVVNLCEMKFVNKSFSISADYAEELRNKIDVFQQETKCRKSIFLTMITTYGIATNKYSGMVQNSLTIDDLFL